MQDDEFFLCSDTTNVQEEVIDDQDVPMPSIPPMDTLPPGQDHSYSAPAGSCVNCTNLTHQVKEKSSEVIVWRGKFQDLHKKYEDFYSKSKREISHLKDKLSKLQEAHVKIKDLPNSESKEAVKVRNEIAKNALILNGNFSSSQIHVILNKHKNPKTSPKKWCNTDFLSAKKLLGVSAKALKIAREAGLPLPAKSTCDSKFAFMHVQSGILKPVILYLRWLMPQLEMKHTLTSFSFDEMKISRLGMYDIKLDALLGPNDYVQLVLVRSILGKWKYPLFFDYDTAITAQHYNELIFQLESVRARVLITLSDQGPKNEGLANELGCSVDNFTVKNPYDSSRKIYFSYDLIHAFKNLRNHMLDDKFRIEEGGHEFSKADFEDLLQKVECQSLQISKLKANHINCVQSARQNVALASELLSNSTSCLMSDFFPNDPRKQQLSQIIDLFDKVFNLMTSKLSDSDSDDITRKPLGGVHHGEQLKILFEFIELLDNLRFQKQNSKKENVPFSKVKCQRGAQISVQCAIALYVTLQTEYNISEYGTQNITQDDLESYFSEIRDMHGNNKEPNALQFNNRVSTHITLQMLKDLDFDIFSLVQEVATDFIKPHFKGSESILFPFKNLSKARTVKKDLEMSEAKKLEIFWVAGNLAYKFQSENLHSNEQENVSHPDTEYLTRSVQNGLILPPSSIWLKEVGTMYQMFLDYHPENSLQKGQGLINGFTNLLVEKFPHRNPAVLKEFTKIRTFGQIRAINTKAKEKKKNLRAMKNLMRTIHS